MNASLEISMYPLTPAYAEPIVAFIKRLRSYPEVEVRTNSMSTRLFGPYDQLMEILTRELRPIVAGKQKTALVFKLINDDLREEPQF